MVAEGIADKLIKCFKSGGKTLICGNGGSASMSQHMAAELMVRFEHDRKPLPAIALTTDTSILTAQSNDYNFDSVFGKQILALGNKGDILIALSTSGKSKNVLYAIEIARSKGMEIIDFPRTGNSTAETQEIQLKLMHDICRLVEKEFI